MPCVLCVSVQAAAVLMGAMALATTTANADSPEPWQWLFQDSATSTAQAMQDLHHDIMFFLITISVVVLYLIGSVSVSLSTRVLLSLASFLAQYAGHATVWCRTLLCW